MLSEVKLREFLSNFDFNRMTNSLWSNLYECFFIHFRKKKINLIETRHSIKQTIEYIENTTNNFNGIIQYLTNKFGGNVEDKGIIKLTSSSALKNELIRYIVDFTNIDRGFASENDVNSWIKFDFLSHKIHLTHYSIKSSERPKGNSHLKNWVIEGSNIDSDDDCKVLDLRNNETCLDSSYAEKTFNVQNSIDDNEYYRFIRVRQTGVNSRRTYQLIVGSIEFFGTIV